MSAVQDDSGRELAAIQGESDRLETEGGPRNPQLTPNLLALGLALRAADRHAEAAAAFLRAVFVIRANEGLYTKRQVPVLELLIESAGAAGDWRAVANARDLMAWIYRRSHDPLDPAQLIALRKLRRWYVGAYNKDTGRTLEELFAASRRVTRQAIDILHNCGGDGRTAVCFFQGACCPETMIVAAGCPASGTPAEDLAGEGESKSGNPEGE
jgi:hypothetical protein